MTPRQIQQFRNALLEWYRANSRKLPWRQTGDPYRIWVSEVMLQQTQVKTVLRYYPRFIKEFPDVRQLATANPQQLLKMWEGMGYYQRVRNLQRAAQIVVNELGGKIPGNYAEFRALPGVGDYIAAAVTSLAYNAPHPVVDGNVKRVLARLFLIDEPINRSSSLWTFRLKGDEILDRSQPGMFNQAMMDLGAAICRPRNPACSSCPVSRFCRAFRSGRQTDFPVRLPSRKVPEYHIAVGVVHRNGKVLITRRKPEGLLGGMWEFPGGKVREGESVEQACLREIAEEVNLSVAIDQRIARVKHTYSHFKIVMDVFFCRFLKGKVKLTGPVDYRWVTFPELDDYPFPAANHKFFPALKKVWIQ